MKKLLGIDWESRKGNKMFWVALVSALIILTESVLKPFGVVADFSSIESNIVNVIEAIFGVLIVIGVVMNPKDPGVSDKELTNSGVESNDIAG